MPSLTTVDRRQELLGKNAVNLLFERSDDVNVQIDTKTIYRESCGCNMQPAMEIKDLRMEYQNKCLIYEEALDSLKCMELDLTGLENIDELCEKMKKYVVGSDMQSFYMCLCDKNELFADKSVCDHFTEKVSIPLAYQNGKFCSYDDFLSKEILPLEIREKSKRTFYTVTPIYYQHICYGYCVSDGSLFALKSELSYLWTVNIGMALENIRKWQWINRMNEKINRMWKYDMLTQVLNRSGFFYCAETILQK